MAGVDCHCPFLVHSPPFLVYSLPVPCLLTAFQCLTTVLDSAGIWMPFAKRCSEFLVLQAGASRISPLLAVTDLCEVAEFGKYHAGSNHGRCSDGDFTQYLQEMGPVRARRRFWAVTRPFLRRSCVPAPPGWRASASADRNRIAHGASPCRKHKPGQRRCIRSPPSRILLSHSAGVLVQGCCGPDGSYCPGNDGTTMVTPVQNGVPICTDECRPQVEEMW